VRERGLETIGAAYNNMSILEQGTGKAELSNRLRLLEARKL